MTKAPLEEPANPLERLLPYAWAAADLPAGLEALALRAGLDIRLGREGHPSFPLSDDDGEQVVSRAIKEIAESYGIEAEAVEVPCGDVDRLLRGACPAVLRFPSATAGRFLMLAGRSGGNLLLLTPQGHARRVPMSLIEEALLLPFAEIMGEIEERIAFAGIPARSRARVRRALMDSFFSADDKIGGCWVLRASPDEGLWRGLRRAGVLNMTAALFGTRAALKALQIASWWLIGGAALRGRLGLGVVAAWALVLATLIPFQILDTWLQGRISIETGKSLKQRLLRGIFHLEKSALRLSGSGDLLGRVMEMSVVETLALNGGFSALVAIVEFAAAAFTLSQAGLLGHMNVLLLASALGMLGLGALLHRRNRRWASARLRLTNDLVEKMVGYRTRLAQEHPAYWHAGEDEATSHYVGVSEALDRVLVALEAWPRAWLLLAFAALAVVFMEGSGQDTSFAVGVGGVLLAASASRSLADGLVYLSEARVAWDQVALLVPASSPRSGGPRPAVRADSKSPPEKDNPSPLIQLTDVTLRYPDRAEPVLRGCNLRITRGDRILLEGPSGGGKSTLGMLLGGLHKPDSGILLLDGIDRRSFGAAAWRERVSLCPQYHENHLFCETIAFNVLMGRSWPPTRADLAEASRVCSELGLDRLLRSMPLGIEQVVGDTGWKLSHGERSRIFIARAILQRSELVIFDESFSALDPETLRVTLECALRRTKTILVIAHP